ncbi:MAG: flagellar basal body rod protein FlgB [Gammaproteobacteria bacterium]|nr:flagellar basal body rod protein FlgB [Gammaproteobacteria bacterium]MCP5407717.1 flagellar basal body rod protein FlgB [Chromatiaceae bacterium]MCP5441672.1 flagellar basal body rod protein FlgB [Chromatiaceae bacterium]
MKLDNAFGIHEQALKLRTHRAELLAGNIANADTPGYKARDFDFQKLMQQQLPSRESMRVTSPRHIQPESGPVSASEIFYRIPRQPSLDGNTVDSQLEHTAYAANAMEYQVSLRFLSGGIRKLMTAIKG